MMGSDMPYINADMSPLLRTYSHLHGSLRPILALYDKHILDGTQAIELVTDNQLSQHDFDPSWIGCIPPPKWRYLGGTGQYPAEEVDRVRSMWWSAASEGACPCGRPARRIPEWSRETTFEGPGQEGRTGRLAP